MKATILIVFCFISYGVYAVRVKIHLNTEKYDEHVFKRLTTNTACSDATQVNRDSLNLPGMLNNLNDRVVFFRSTIAMDNFNSFLDLTQVPLVNVPFTTLRQVLELLASNTCYPFFFGGSVRDQFLGRTPNDADIEIDCPIETFFNVCVSAYSEPNCGRASSRPVGHVGVLGMNIENVDVASTTTTFYAPISHLEYTANSMAYDLNGNDVIIDLTGTGETDVCNTHIRIPSEDDSIESWNQWLNDTNRSALLRFWKLRIKGFIAYNNATLNFITSQSILLINDDTNSFGNSYCYNVYGSNYNPATKTCSVNLSVCEANTAKAMRYNMVLAEDFGEYWKTEIEPNLLPTCGSSAANIRYSISSLSVFLLIGSVL